MLVDGTLRQWITETSKMFLKQQNHRCTEHGQAQEGATREVDCEDY